MQPNYTKDNMYNKSKPTISGILHLVTALILYGYLIPISLYVSIELVKVLQAMFINKDLSMFDEVSGKPAEARTSNLNEELGQVDTILSDKTGTLTCNQMDFLKCSIVGVSYGVRASEVELAAAKQIANDQNSGTATPRTPMSFKTRRSDFHGSEIELHGVITSNDRQKEHKTSIKGFSFEDVRLMNGNWPKESTARNIMLFFRILTLCQTALPEPNEETGSFTYEAESPDEAAFLVAAREFGFEFCKRTQSTVVVRERYPSGNPEEREYKILNKLEFDSKRKRVSVIVQDEDGQILLLCKGADSFSYICDAESEASKTSPYEITQMPLEPAYGADQSGYGVANGTQPYYQPHPQQGSTVPYAEPYQQQFSGSYGGGYSTPSPYQQTTPQVPSPYQQVTSPYQQTTQQTPPQTPQQATSFYPQPSSYQPTQPPQIFTPTQTPHVPSTTFPPATVAQPTVHSFAPSNSPPLRNVEKYQHTTLGAQPYPGAANPTYQTMQPSSAPLGPGSVGGGPSQMGSIPGHTMSQAPTPIPAQRPFMPAGNNNATGFSQRPAMGASMQAPSPAQPSQVAAVPTPATPPPTVQTVDTSKVPAHQKLVINTLTRLFNETSEALGGPRAPPGKKREVDDNSKKMGALFAKLNIGDISKNAADKLVQLCQALDNGDFASALQIQVQMTTSEWDECNFWLAT